MAAAMAAAGFQQALVVLADDDGGRTLHLGSEPIEHRLKGGQALAESEVGLEIHVGELVASALEYGFVIRRRYPLLSADSNSSVSHTGPPSLSAVRSRPSAV